MPFQSQDRTEFTNHNRSQQSPILITKHGVIAIAGAVRCYDNLITNLVFIIFINHCIITAGKSDKIMPTQLIYPANCTGTGGWAVLCNINVVYIQIQRHFV